MRRFVTSALAVLPLAACGDDSTPGTTNLGVAGASCVRTPDCAAPLQCIENVCRAVSSEADATGADASPDIAETVYSVDGTNPFLPDETPEIVTAYDVADWEFIDETSAPDTEPTTAPETTGEVISPFEDCGDLGVASSWSGTFVGAIDYNVTPNPLTPSTGQLPVNGNLAFDIQCIESKFIVRGTMDGVATVVNQGDFPFKLSIAGTYDPVEKAMNAKMKDGSVSIYGLIEVYFEGDFIGSIGADDQFHGEWSGYSTGTNQAFITGDATGEGLWGAEAQ